MSITATSSRATGAGTTDLQLGRSTDRLLWHAAIAGASFVAYILHKLTSGGASTAFAVVGLGACGWAWLLTRTLFEAPGARQAWWPRIVVGVVAASSALAVLAPAGGVTERVADNAYVLSGSAALMLTFVEPFNHYSRDMPSAEKRFRLIFLALYALLVAASVLGVWASTESVEDRVRDNLIKIGCASASLIAAAAAAGFRLRHPLRPPPVSRRVATDDDARLAERLTRLLREEGIDREPDLRIGEVADRLGVPEYRVSQCISAAMGFPNFNRLINHHRIERAKARLADADDDASILEIAFDCGFGSIGPFNRAFKDQVGATPRAYRSAARRS